MGFHRSAKIIKCGRFVRVVVTAIIAVTLLGTSLSACSDPNAPPSDSVLVYVHAPPTADSYYHPGHIYDGAREIVDVCTPYFFPSTAKWELYAIKRFTQNKTAIHAGTVYRVNVNKRGLTQKGHDCIPVPKGLL
jgi:hypothetical protein